MYDPSLPSGYPKVTYPLEISFWIRNIFTHGRPLPGCFSSTAKPPVHRVDVVCRDVITGSRESRDHLLSFTEFWILYCPNIIFHSDGERHQGRCRRPWLSETWRTMIPWWRHQMESVSALLAISVGNSPVPGEFTTQRPVTRSFDVFFDLRLNKRLSKQWWGCWFETLLRSLWRHSNVFASLCASHDAAYLLVALYCP